MLGSPGTPVAETARPPRKGPIIRQRRPSNRLAGIFCAGSQAARQSAATLRRFHCIRSTIHYRLRETVLLTVVQDQDFYAPVFRTACFGVVRSFWLRRAVALN